MAEIERIVINSDKSMIEADTKLLQLYQEHRHLTLSIRPGVNRSVEQNSLWAAMYKRIATMDGWTFNDARAHCKLYYGIPILQRDCEGFDASFKRVFGQLSTEQALRLMNPNKLFPVDGFPVTRNFGTKQGCEYTDAIVMNITNVSFHDLLDKS